MLLQFISVMVISRILTPEDLGGYSLALGSIAVGQVLRDFGLSLYLVKEKEITDEKVQGCFTISIIVCWILAFIYFISANYIGVFFEQESIVVLTQILAFNFLIIPFGTFTLSLLRRNMLFDKIMFIDILSSIVSTVASVILIITYKTVEVLALASVFGTLTTVLLTFKYTSWRYFKINFRKIVVIAKFSGFVSGANILDELRSVVPEFLIGKYSSVEDVAYLSKANGTINLFSKLITGVIAPVIQPFLSKIHNESGSIEKHVYQITHYMLAFQWPFCGFVYVYAEEIIFLLYGPQWEVAIPLIKVCCVLFLIDGLAVLGIQMLNSVGDVKYVLSVSVIMTLMRITFVMIFVKFGLYVLVLSFIPLAIIRSTLLLYRYKMFFKVSFLQLFIVYRLNAGIAIITFMICNLSHNLFKDFSSDVIQLAFAALLFCLSWLIALSMLKHPLKEKITELYRKVLMKISSVG
ncbi:Membrane protein involved in the export of O-antigen and teichoic acid [Neptunomonas qingdaonensis]|uniref:Membrane protein involved in the export of O-antigen and teichoic acid n=2 Tax=Neptunomonas qingdaonensis TaxID=1045558 RepID=A0A1I2N0W6_9GAMM|nr:Membrane protein involved in the export of O-antigen and teichoic acid [Neptunomonas qingdaonensis]